MFIFVLQLLFLMSNERLSYLQQNKLLYPVAEDLIKSRCFSNILVNLDEECENPYYASKCTYKTCIVPRENIDKSNNVCRTGKEEHNTCVFENQEENDMEIGVNLSKAMQIYSGYKKNAAEIWDGIYSIADGNKTLTRLISGIHYSITLHIAIYYKYSCGKYWSNPCFYYEKMNHEYYNNLIFAFKVVKYALTSLEDAQFKCSLELPEDDAKKLKKFKKLIQKINGELPNSFEHIEYKGKMASIKKLLNCIECDMCKLWGKIQFNGLETALDMIAGIKSKITGNELIMLLNLYFKLSSSLMFNEKLSKKIKCRYLYFISLYMIEILTVLISLIIFFVVNNSVKKRRKHINEIIKKKKHTQNK